MALRQGYPTGRTRGIRPKKQLKPGGTRCYVPGFLSDEEQFSIDQSQLGISPLAIASVAKSAGVKISFKKGRPRMFGGPLVDTVTGVRAQVESGSLSAIDQMNRDRLTNKDRKHRAAWQRIWSEVLPTWRLASMAQYERIKQMDPSLQVVAPTAQPTLTQQQPVIAPAQQPVLTPQPGSQPTQTVVYLPSPSGGQPQAQLPIPASQLPGGEPQVPDEVARPQVTQAGMFSGDMGKFLLPAVGLFILTQVLGKKGR